MVMVFGVRAASWVHYAAAFISRARAPAPAGRNRPPAFRCSRSAGGLRRSRAGTLRGDQDRRQETERQKQAIGRELSLVASEISAGASLGQALRNLADRTAVEDIRPLAATLIQSEQLGAQIAPALHASSDALRTRRRLRAEEAAQKTTIKILFPLVLFILPAMFMVIMGPAVMQIIHTMSK